MIIIDLHPQISLKKQCTEIAVGNDGELYIEPRANLSKNTGITMLKVLHTGRTVTSPARYDECLIQWTRDALKEKGAYRLDDTGAPIFSAEKLKMS